MAPETSSTLRTFGGAVALVTGAGSGVGAALSHELAARGATVVLADRHEESASEHAAQLPAGRAEALALDVRDADAVERAVAGVFERHGRLDYLFNNAGIAVGGEARALSLDDWHAAVEVNLLGVVHGVAAGYPRMVAQGFGHIVNTASMAAFVATPMAGPYGATKAAVASLSRGLRLEAMHFGVRVSALCPGVIRTPILVDGGRYGRVVSFIDSSQQSRLWERLRPMAPARFARQALDAVERNRAVIVVPSWWRAIRFLNGIAPSLADRLASRQLSEIWALVESRRG
jgi:NADP-dependent 3-hydroxy acid dehydrogenase YdfG